MIKRLKSNLIVEMEISQCSLDDQSRTLEIRVDHRDYAHRTRDSMKCIYS